MRLVRSFQTWWKYARSYGFANASLYALYRLSPVRFVLLEEAIKRNPAAGAASPVYFTRVMSEVFHFSAWTDLGGAAMPADQDGADDCLIWFVPDWLNVWGGGHYTLFRFANHFARYGRRNIIYVYNNQRHASPDHLQSELQLALSPCRIEVIVDPRLLPKCAGAIATTWQSAYFVRAFPFARRKFYFMQDYESLFYAYGTASMQANATYGFGFKGITGGAWLRSRYEAHGGVAREYRFAADRQIFYPHDERGKVRSVVKRLFFYGRPSTERRCFELGISALALIAEKFPNVEIVIAGLDLQSKPDFPAILLGNMSLAETGRLYRTCDIGLAFSATNLSYLPVELMASGVPVISNNGPHVEWHCKHLENCMLVEPVPEQVLEAFARLYHDIDLRQSLVDGGLATMSTLNWEDEMSNTLDYIEADLAVPTLNSASQLYSDADPIKRG